MANFVPGDRVKDTSSSYGSSSFTLDAATIAGFRTFNAGVGDGNFCFYCAVDASGNWEDNFGSYTDSTKALTRETTPISSSNSNAAVTFSGAVTIFAVNPAKLVGAQENWGLPSGRLWINYGWTTGADAGSRTLSGTNVRYMPVLVRQPFRTAKVHFNISSLFVGTATIDVGIYDNLNGTPNTRLAQQTGINAGTGGATGEVVTSSLATGIQPPGMYYVGMAFITNTPTLIASASLANNDILGATSVAAGSSPGGSGWLYMAESGSSLPTSPNPVRNGSDWAPYVGIEAIL